MYRPSVSAVAESNARSIRHVIRSPLQVTGSHRYSTLFSLLNRRWEDNQNVRSVFYSITGLEHRVTGWRIPSHTQRECLVKDRPQQSHHITTCAEWTLPRDFDHIERRKGTASNFGEYGPLCWNVYVLPRLSFIPADPVAIPPCANCSANYQRPAITGCAETGCAEEQRKATQLRSWNVILSCCKSVLVTRVLASS